MMTQDLINRYQPGGDIYISLASQIGAAGASSVAAAALSGDETQINAALVQAQYGQPLNTSTLSIFAEQLATDPLGAPLQSLETVLKNTAKDFFTNPFILIAVGAGVFIYFGGIKYLQKKFNG